MPIVLVEQEPTLQMINSVESKAIEKWEELYPDLWLLLEITHEDEWEVYEGKLIAVAKDSMEFVEIAKSFHERGIANLTTRGVHTQPQPILVA